MSGFIYHDDFALFKADNKQMGKSELLKRLHQTAKQHNLAFDIVEGYKRDILNTQALNEALIDLLEAQDVDIKTALSQEILAAYVSQRKNTIKEFNGSITEEGMKQNAEFAAQDALTENARQAGKFDKKTKPTKEELAIFKAEWSETKCLETDSITVRGWKKAACRRYEITLNTLNAILNAPLS